MHVCLDISRSGWGVSKVVESLSEEQRQLGNQVKVLGMLTRRWKDHDRLLWGGATPEVYFKGPFSSLYILFVVISAIRFRPDVVHFHGLWGPHIFVGRILQILKFNCFVSPHGMLSEKALKISAYKKKFFSFVLQNRFLTQCKGIVGSCSSELDDIASSVRMHRYTSIPNGTDLPFDVAKDNFFTGVVSYIGRIDKKKGLDNLLKAWAILPDRKGYVLNIYGNDSRGFISELQSLIDSYNLNDVYIFPPVYDEQFNNVVQRSSFFVLPSLGEGWPLIIGEVLALKCPVLVTPETSYIMADEAGFGVVANSDPVSLSIGLKSLMSKSNAQLENMGNKGRSWVCENLVWSKIAISYVEFYNDCI